jgi:hypothetical protein
LLHVTATIAPHSSPVIHPQFRQVFPQIGAIPA